VGEVWTEVQTRGERFFWNGSTILGLGRMAIRPFFVFFNWSDNSYFHIKFNDMKSSSLQLRKISLIEYLLGIQDEKTFDKIESSIQKSLKSIKPVDIVFSKNELVERAEFSNNQIKKGHVLSQKELETQSKNW
jgi:hypothetical protein